MIIISYLNPIRFGCFVIYFGDIREVVRLSLLVEKYGLDTLAVPDHLFHPLYGKIFTNPPYETFTTLSLIASQTKRVKLLTAVTDSVRRHPVVLAHTVATLDHISNGRMNLGIGAGEAFNFAPINDVNWEKPYTRFKETVHLLKALWASSKEQPVNFNGEYFRVRNAHLGFKPVQQPNSPIYFGAYGPKMRALTGTLADGWLPWIIAPDQYKEDLSLIMSSAKKVGRDSRKIDPAVLVPSVVLPDPDEAWKAVVPGGKVRLFLRASLLRRLGYPDIAEKCIDMWKMEFNENQIKKLENISDEVPLEAVKKVSVAGTADDAIDQIERFIEAGVRHFIFFPTEAKFEETLKEYRDKIIPYFKGK